MREIEPALLMLMAAVVQGLLIRLLPLGRLGIRPVANLILSRGMGLVAVGLATGLIASYWATRLLQQLLFGVESTDPGTFVVTSLGFGLVALLACLAPAWRATRVDPAVILQAE